MEIENQLQVNFKSESDLNFISSSSLPLPVATKSAPTPSSSLSRNKATNKRVSLNQETSSSSLSCSDCGRHFVSLGKLKSHEKTHSKSRPFKCIDFNKTFTVRYSLICHTRTHTRERPYQCSLCGSRFTQASSLKTHVIYKHTKQFPYCCKLCGRGFISPGQKAEHVTRTHNKGGVNSTLMTSSDNTSSSNQVLAKKSKSRASRDNNKQSRGLASIESRDSTMLTSNNASSMNVQPIMMVSTQSQTALSLPPTLF